MLEGLLATLLNRFLGIYIRNFDPKQLNVGIWSGDVKLRDLELRREALDQLRLPINVVEGYVGLLTLSIPWSNLKGKPVKVFIEDVYLVAAPKEDAEYDEEEEARRQQALKMEKLDNAEILKDRAGGGLSAEDQQKNQSFTDSLITKVVDNLQISIKRIHFRYEDSLSAPEHPFALGLTLAELSAASTNEQWNPTFIQNPSDATHKLVKLGALAAYWNTDSELLGSGKGTQIGPEEMGVSHEEIKRRLCDAIAGIDESIIEGHQFLLRPVNGRMKVTMNKAVKTDRPKVKAALAFEEIGVVLDDDQYRDALMMVDLFHYFILHQQYKKYQPKNASPKEDPKAWLRFAGEAVLQNIRDRNRRWTWAFMKQRRDDRQRYVELFKKKRKGQAMSNAEKEDIENLEWKVRYEDLRFWRSLARSELRKEDAGAEKPNQPKRSQGWTGWIWGSGKQHKDTKEHDDHSGEIITDQHRKELYDAIEWDEKHAIAASVDVPRDAVKLEVEASLQSGSFTLKQDPHGKNKNVLELLFDSFRAKAIQRPDSLLGQLSLDELRAYDGTTEGNMFPQIVRVKEPARGQSYLAELDDAEQSTSEQNRESTEKVPFFDVEFEQNPLDGSADSTVTVRLKGMEVIYNPLLVVRITEFFKPPERHLESIAVLMETAGATVEGLRQQTRAGLEFALEEHKTINAKLDLQAPLIIIPERVTSEDSLCMILDAGHIRLRSELVDRATLDGVRSKQKHQLNEGEHKRLEGLMYDKFTLKLTDTQLLIGPSIRVTKGQLAHNDKSRALHLIDRINIDFILEISILPKAQEITRFRMSGQLPLLHVSISDSKYNKLMKLIETATPKFGRGVDIEPSTRQDSQRRHIQQPPETSSRPGNPRLQSNSFQLSDQEHDIVIEDEDEVEKQPKQRDENISGSQIISANLHQNTFEFKFTVDKLQGSLFKTDADRNDAEQLLIDMVAESFELRILTKPILMVAEVSLQSLSVDDHIENGSNPEFQKIITSEPDRTKGDGNLLRVKYEKVNRECPDYMTFYEGIDTHINVSLATINLVITRKSLLTLLDFAMVTFQSPAAPPDSAKGDVSGNSQIKSNAPLEPDTSTADKMRIKINLSSIVSILNNDGVRLATLSLESADVGIFLGDKRMRISARLGTASLVDDVNQGAPVDSPFRQLITIDGSELADFRYETFDPDAKDSYPGYNSLIFLRCGSFKLNFLQGPFRSIIDFFVKFGKMQAIFNAARQAAMNQAIQIQESASNTCLDIVVSTPIIVFPKSLEAEGKDRDVLTAYLGEIYANNKFVPLDDSKQADVANELSAGIRHIRMTSGFHYSGKQSQELEIIDKVDLGLQIMYLEHRDGRERPDLEVQASLSNFNLRLTQTQMQFLMELSKSIPVVFAIDEEEKHAQALKELPKSTTEPAKILAETPSADNQSAVVNLQPELGRNSNSWTKLDLVFKVETIGLELLLGGSDTPINDVKAASLSTFSLDSTSVKLRMMSDNSLESELMIHSFTVMDNRKQSNTKFRKIMSTTNPDVQQFIASITISGGQERSSVIIMTLDSPKAILAVDYLIAIQQFVTIGLSLVEANGAADQSLQDGQSSETGPRVTSERNSNMTLEKLPRNDALSANKISEESQSQEGSSIDISFRINVVSAQAILIANPGSSASEAIVLSTKQILMSQQHALTLQISQVGMFLCRMDKFDSSRLRILDDFSIQLSMQSRSRGQQSSLTSIHIGVEHLILRLSLRDILLALEIINKASELSNKEQDTEVKDEAILDVTDNKASSLTQKQSFMSTKVASNAHLRSEKTANVGRATVIGDSSGRVQSVIIKREEMVAEVEGIRVILIGDGHELPLIDFTMHEFSVGVRDWSTHLNGDANVDLYVNIYNFSKSAWEPLIEPWQLGFHVSQQRSPDYLSLELYSRKMLELTLTSASIALSSRSAKFLSQEEDVSSNPRSVGSPYRIRNQTGFDLSIWADAVEADGSEVSKLSDGSEIPWQFEGWEKVRENLTPEGSKGSVGARLEKSGFDDVKHIPVTREGEVIYSLRPKRDNVLHRLLVEVKLGNDNVKYITFRSPLLLENKTQIPIELGVFDVNNGHLSKIEKVPPGESRPAPVGAAYMHSILVRPDQGFGYSWSEEKLYWKDILKRSVRSLTCRSESGSQSSRFFFQTSANFDKNNPLTSIYPCMRIRLSAPLELQNLLPYDFKYRIYDKHTKKDWTNFLRKGGSSPVHVVELSHLLLMSIEMQDTVFKISDFAIVNAGPQDEFRRESTVVVQDDHGLSLHLKLHYFNIPDSGGAFRVSVYCPYVILNKTGLEVEMKSKSLLQPARAAAGQGVWTDEGQGNTRKALPYLFSYNSNDRQNRALLKVGDSGWSKPQSLDAVGSSVEVVLPSAGKHHELSVGLSVVEGEGKYKLCKTVTIAPRFILKSDLLEDINYRELGSTSVLTLKKGGLAPLRYLRCDAIKQLCLCFPSLNNQWSSPFNISDIGRTHVKLARAGQRQELIRVEVMLEQATLFLYLSREQNNWPFSVRNETDTEFMFFQANPTAEDEEPENSSAWRPIRYRLPPRSIMPYAWDFPAAERKELVVTAHGKERHVSLAEIGNLLPMKLPATPASRQSKIIDINVAANGPTQTLVLSNYQQSTSLYRQKSAQASQSSQNTGFEVKNLDTKTTFKAQLHFAGIGLSLVNRQMRELAYLTFRDIELKYHESALYQTVNASIKWIQIDNQLYGGIFPLILYPSVVPKTGKEMDVHPNFHAMATRVKDNSYGVLYIKYATILLQQMTLEIDEDFIFALLDFSKIPGASWSDEVEGKLCDEDLDIPEPHQEHQGQDIYFELLHIQPAQLDLSFVRTERVNVEDKTTSRNPLMFFLNVMTMAIGNVNDAPVRLNSLMLENARVSLPVLLQHVQSHYSQEFLFQVHKILGSADFLGNPVGLFNNISSGVADIFYEPYQGLIMTDRPQELGIGIAKGATSFVKKSVFGVTDSMSKFTGSISKGLAAATLDKQFQDRRRMTRARNRPKHALFGVTEGANSFVTSVASGVGGLARKPLEGAEREGVAGFFKGVGKGVLGLATKPAVGVFDLASNVTEGIRNTTTVFDNEGLDRVRLPRHIGHDDIVRPYSQREALGQFWLKQLDNGNYFDEEYIAHLDLPRDDVIVMLTYNRIMLVKNSKLTTEWDVPLRDIQTISKERTGLSITLKGGTNGPYVPVVDESSRNFLYRQIGVAVKAFNEKYLAKEQ